MERKLFGDKRECGIYAFKHNGVIIYVGKTNNFTTRMLNHKMEITKYGKGKLKIELKKYAYLYKHKDDITWDVLSNVYSSAEENKYIKLYDPLLNTYTPSIGKFNKKEYQKVYREKNKAKAKEYRNKPENKVKAKAYQKKYRTKNKKKNSL